MKKLFRITGLVFLGVSLLAGAFSCSPQAGVSQEEYDAIKSQLDEASVQIAALQSQLAQGATQQAQYTKLQQDYDALKGQNDANVQRINTLDSQLDSLESQIDTINGEKLLIQSSYNELQATYQDLQQKYQELISPSQPITEEAVQQAIFDSINVERVNNGLTPLGWGYNMYGVARQNSIEMANLGRFYYAQTNYFQQLFWAAGYNSVESIAHGAMLTWKANQYQYEHGMLSKAFKYCAIGAYKEGDVIFITSMMSDFP